MINDVIGQLGEIIIQVWDGFEASIVGIRRRSSGQTTKQTPNNQTVSIMDHVPQKKIIMNVVRVSVDALMNVALMPLMVQYQVDMSTQQVIRDAVSRAVGLLENAFL